MAQSLFVLRNGQYWGGNHKSRLRYRTEPAVFFPNVAMQHALFASAIAFGVLLSARASFWLDNNDRKLFECFNEDLPKSDLILPNAFSSLVNVQTSHLLCTDWNWNNKGCYGPVFKNNWNRLIIRALSGLNLGALIEHINHRPIFAHVGRIIEETRNK